MVLTASKELEPGMDKVKVLKHFPPYGSINATCASDTCPTCRGTGRIPRGWCSTLALGNEPLWLK